MRLGMGTPGLPSTGLTALAQRVAPGARAVVIASSKDDNPKVTLLLMPPGATRPTLAVKVATTDRAADSVRGEADVLQALDRQRLGAAASTVPRVLDLLDHEGRPAMVSDALPGAPMTIAYHAWHHTGRVRSVAQDFALARGWLQSLPLTDQAAPVGPESCWSRRLADRWSGDAAVSRVREPLERLETDLASASRCGGVVHGDFWCGNVLTDRATVTGVVDWEAAQTSGDVLRDWRRFALSYSLYLDRHTRPGRAVSGHRGLKARRWGDGLRWVFTGRGWYPDLVRHFLIGAVQRVGLPADAWRAVALIGLAEIATVSDNEDFARKHLDVLTELVGVEETLR
jgi:aminoglycoside phosphotransferase